MRISFAVIIFLFSFKAYSQDTYFVNDSWKNIGELAKKKNQPIMVYVYSEQCKSCEDINLNFISDSSIMDRYSKDMILYKVNSSLKNSKKIISKYNVREIPSILIILPNGNLFRKLIITETLPNLILSDFIENSKKEFDIYYNYYQNFQNADLLKKYLIQRISYGKQWSNQELLENYLNKISVSEKENEETLNLILKAGFSLDKEAINVLYKHLQIATLQQNLIKQYLIKIKIFDSIVETINRGTLQSKINLKKAFEITNKINDITPNFKAYDNQMLELIYYANAKNKNRFIKIAKQYFDKNERLFNPKTLYSIDSIYSHNIKNYSPKDSLSINNQKLAIKDIPTFNTNNEAYKLALISKVIYFQQILPKNLEFGIKCGKKSIEIAPHANNYAILGLLYNKNEQFKLAYEMLSIALYLKTNNEDEIDSDIRQNVISVFLEIKNRTPEN